MEILQSGVYRIASWPGDLGPESRVLTAGENGVTVTAPGAAPAREQEFSVEVGENGLCAIQIPALLFPSRSLTYKKGEKGERVILGPVSDFPTRQWRITPVPNSSFPPPFHVKVANDEESLAMIISPNSPEIELAPSSQDLAGAWAFMRLVQDY